MSSYIAQNNELQELTKILSPLTGHTELFVINSTKFVQCINQLTLEDSDRMSFGIVSLFTQVPLDGALQVISTLLNADESLEERTSIPPDIICKHVEFCLHSTHQRTNIYFEQVEGAAIGSPLSAIVANLFMETPLKGEPWRQQRSDLKSGSDTLLTYSQYGTEMNNSSDNFMNI